MREGPDKRPPWWKRLWARTGFGDKTLWDLLQLLIAPLALAAIGTWFAAQQDVNQQHIENQRAQAERELAEQRAQDEALQAYLNQMGNLLLEKDLRNSEEGSEVRTLARARILTVLGRLNGERNAAVVQFLREAKLIGEKDPVVRLDTSNLSGAHLSRIVLSYLDLSHTYLSDANLSGSDIRRVGLSETNLSNANLTDAQVTEEQLREAASLEGATMLNGQKYEEWLKDK